MKCSFKQYENISYFQSKKIRMLIIFFQEEAELFKSHVIWSPTHALKIWSFFIQRRIFNSIFV